MLRNLFCIVVAVVWTALMFVGTLIAMAVTLNRSASMWVVQRWWSPVLLWAGGAKFEVTGLEKLQRASPTSSSATTRAPSTSRSLFVALPVDLALRREEGAQVRADARLVHVAGEVRLHRSRQPPRSGALRSTRPPRRFAAASASSSSPKALAATTGPCCPSRRAPSRSR